jgi:hypothetical protein
LPTLLDNAFYPRLRSPDLCYLCHVKSIGALIAISIFAACPAQAVILFRTDDPTANKTASSNDFAGSGSNYERQFGSSTTLFVRLRIMQQQ